MDELRIILNGHNHHVLQYLKCIIEQIKKDGKAYPVQWILNGIVVIGHVYTMLLCYSRSIEKAKTGTTRAIGLYIEFIAQISMIENCGASYTPYTIGCKDASQFVYKKIFPDGSSDHTVPDVSIVTMSLSDVDKYLETLHEYKQIIQNLVKVLFSKELFVDKVSYEASSLYYSKVISCLLDLNTTIEGVPIDILLYREIVSSQCDNSNAGCHTENMSPEEYLKWINGLIYHYFD